MNYAIYSYRCHRLPNCSDSAARIQQRQIGDIVARQARHMTVLIDDLLDVSRVTRRHVKLDFQAVSVADVIVRAQEQTAPSFALKGQRLQTRVKGKIPPVYGDSLMLLSRLTPIFSLTWCLLNRQQATELTP